MTLILELPPEVEARITAAAARRGVSPAEYLIELALLAAPEAPSPDHGSELEEVEDLLPGTWPEDEPRPTTPAEVVAYWRRHGLLGTRPDITESLEHVRQMRRKAERRDWS